MHYNDYLSLTSRQKRTLLLRDLESKLVNRTLKAIDFVLIRVLRQYKSAVQILGFKEEYDKEEIKSVVGVCRHFSEIHEALEPVYSHFPLDYVII